MYQDIVCVADEAVIITSSANRSKKMELKLMINFFDDLNIIIVVVVVVVVVVVFAVTGVIQ